MSSFFLQQLDLIYILLILVNDLAYMNKQYIFTFVNL